MASLSSSMLSTKSTSRATQQGRVSIIRNKGPLRSVVHHAGADSSRGPSSEEQRPVSTDLPSRAISERSDAQVAQGSAYSGGVRPVVAALNIKLESDNAEDVDSRSYMQDMLNLSVDLDPEDDGPEVETPELIVVESSAAPAAGQLKEEQEPKVSAERLAARKLVANHDPTEVTAGEKHHWMVVTVPERPMGGETCVLYFNRNQSAALRERPRIQLQYAFNGWALKPESADRVDLVPANITREAGADFWTCSIKVPKETYEMNFIFSDGEFTYENNSGQDFVLPVAGGFTWEDWIDLTAEKAAAEEKAKQLAAAEAAAAAEKERQAKALVMDKERGRKRANDLRNGYEQMQANACTVFRVGGPEGPIRWSVKPEQPLAGSKFMLRYNIKAGPLAFLNLKEGEVPSLRYGFNGWTSPGVAPMTRSTAKAAEGEQWYEVEVSAPPEAVVMNLVFNFHEHYDNNDRRDYSVKIGLPAGLTLDAWADSLAETFRKQEFETRTAAEELRKKKEQARLDARKAAQDAVKAVERRKVRHVLYTEPEVVSAGQEVTVYYNPRDTVLNGRERIYMFAGFNRWDHPKKYGPMQMIPPADGGMHFRATVKAPINAYKMDIVFSDVEGGPGTYDNRGGFDYHLPVEGSPIREPSMHVVHISVEMAPIAKVGGLGDVVTALGRAVQEQGHLVEVVLPRYDFFLASPVLGGGNMKYETEFDWGGTRIFVSSAIVEGLRCFFIEPRNGFFATNTPYGRYDDEVRFDFFCKAALEFLLRTGRQPDILHCHDWSTASVARAFWQDYQPYGLWKPKVVFTIHNLNYGQKKLAEAAFFSQKFTTVSPTYAYETGGNPIIAPHAHKFMGIRNGIDLDLWDPENNQFLPVSYNSSNVVEGKRAARKALRQRLGLSDWGDKFIVGVVSRLTGQKGVHLIKHAAYRAIDRGGQFVLLGSAPDPKVQAEFNGMANNFNGSDAAFCFKYDEPLSHLIYAACDMICVPSMFEPCGLTQMIAMRYGSVPIVRHTGGLRDTVFDVDFDKERAAWDVYGSSDWKRDGLDATNGFAFGGTDTGALDYAMNRAIDAWYNDRAWFHSLQKRVMEQDWSWNRPALDYIELYHSAKKA